MLLTTSMGVQYRVACADLDVQKLNIKALAVTLRTSQPGETGLGPHTPSTCAGMCNQLLL